MPTKTIGRHSGKSSSFKIRGQQAPDTIMICMPLGSHHFKSTTRKTGKNCLLLFATIRMYQHWTVPHQNSESDVEVRSTKGSALVIKAFKISNNTAVQGYQTPVVMGPIEKFFEPRGGPSQQHPAAQAVSWAFPALWWKEKAWEDETHPTWL
eukprot:1150720-Pelagomonas_calceolata.AAC.6